MPDLNPKLFNVLIDAYRPCCQMTTCKQAVWSPERGHIPRGFLGATKNLSDVKVVMVFSEPGHPHSGEEYDPTQPPERLLKSGLQHVHRSFRCGRDLFHRNVRWFLSQLFPNLDFDEQLEHAWLTEGRLCSIKEETGTAKDPRCAKHYLAQQLKMLPKATVVGFGGKAQYYLRHAGVEHEKAYALSPPGANHKPARPSWERVIAKIRAIT